MSDGFGLITMEKNFRERHNLSSSGPSVWALSGCLNLCTNSIWSLPFKPENQSDWIGKQADILITESYAFYHAFREKNEAVKCGLYLTRAGGWCKNIVDFKIILNFFIDIRIKSVWIFEVTKSIN